MKDNSMTTDLWLNQNKMQYMMKFDESCRFGSLIYYTSHD